MDKHISSIFLLLVKNYRYKVKIIKNIRSELYWLNSLLKEISNNIIELNKQNIISNLNFIQNCKLITELNNIINKLTNNLSIKRVSFLGSYIIGIKISKIRLKIINVISKIGCSKLNNIFKIFFNIYLEEIILKNYKIHNNATLFSIINDYYNIISVDIYNLKEFELTNNIDNSIFSFYKLIDFKKNLNLKINGCKIYIPHKDKLLILTGYFNNIFIDLFKNNKLINKKYNELNEIFKKCNLNISFKLNYIEQLTIRDILLYSTQDLLKQCKTYYNDYKKLKNKNISIILKDFINTDICNQRDIINLFLLNNNKSKNNIFIIYILFDILNQSNNDKNLYLKSQELFYSFNYNFRENIQEFRIKSESLIKNINNLVEDNISYEKKILLFNAPDIVKNKAFEKLREINSTKSGENNSKAIQYVEGLLKIPFGNYKKEPIISQFENNKQSFINFIKKYNFDFIDINVEENIFKADIDFSLKLIKKELLEISKKELNLLLIDLNNNNLKELLKKIDTKIDTSKVKKKEILHMIENRVNDLDLYSRLEYNIFNKKYNKSHLIDLIEYEKEWNLYNKNIQDYFKFIDKNLNDTVYGMEEAKLEIKRIIAQWINGKNNGYIFGLEGPPGTGKTTFAKNGIASCLKDENGLNRPFYFIALGGSSNGSTLEGHNYTYVGSTWGRIVDGLMESKCMNPIIFIDELDKISNTEQGKELIGILIHLTDPTQNNEFMDKYFSGIQIDISKCLIIFSYNDVDKIDKILLDRIHRINIKLLNKYDKVNITRKFLLPSICKEVGISYKNINIEDDTIIYLINSYTYEAGVRKLKECLYDIIRELNLMYLTNNNKSISNINLDISLINKIFSNKSTIQVKKINNNPSIGLVNGLFATAQGLGGITIIETYKFLTGNKLVLELTGNQGDVMKESMKVAKTIAWNLLPLKLKQKIKKEESFGIHIHCPETSTPKDGPSAGAAITVALVSLLSNIPIDNNVAITGEIDLNGNILKIGGLEYKIEGAIIAGVTKIICPKQNIEDVNKIKDSDYFKKIYKPNIEIIMVENIFEVLDIMLLGTNKFSNIYNHYYSLGLTCEEYLYMFKNICDNSDEFICILDTSDNFKILYSSKIINTLFDRNLLDISILDLCNKEYKNDLTKLLLNTKYKNEENCMIISYSLPINNKFILHIKKIDNIITCTMKEIKDTLNN